VRESVCACVLGIFCWCGGGSALGRGGEQRESVCVFLASFVVAAAALHCRQLFCVMQDRPG
jgi:hypothetical protein